jgi:hypothetical protein
MIKSKRMTWARHVACMEEMRNSCRILVGELEGKDNLEDLGIDGRIILRWSLEKWGLKVWTGFIWLRIQTSGGLL